MSDSPSSNVRRPGDEASSKCWYRAAGTPRRGRPTALAAGAEDCRVVDAAELRGDSQGNRSRSTPGRQAVSESSVPPWTTATSLLPPVRSTRCATPSPPSNECSSSASSSCWSRLCLLVWFVGRRALKPLEDVIATTDSIDYDNLAERITPTSNARDVEHLAHAVNEMLTPSKPPSPARKTPTGACASSSPTPPTNCDTAGRGARLHRAVRDRRCHPPRPSRQGNETHRHRRRPHAATRRGPPHTRRLDEGRPPRSSTVAVNHVVAEAIAAAQLTDEQHTFALDGKPARGCLGRSRRPPPSHRQPAGQRRKAHPSRLDSDDQCAIRLDVAVVTITDDGPGMTSADRQRAFDRSGVPMRRGLDPEAAISDSPSSTGSSTPTTDRSGSTPPPPADCSPRSDYREPRTRTTPPHEATAP